MPRTAVFEAVVCGCLPDPLPASSTLAPRKRHGLIRTWKPAVRSASPGHPVAREPCWYVASNRGRPTQPARLPDVPLLPTADLASSPLSRTCSTRCHMLVGRTAEPSRHLARAIAGRFLRCAAVLAPGVGTWRAARAESFQCSHWQWGHPARGDDAGPAAGHAEVRHGPAGRGVTLEAIMTTYEHLQGKVGRPPTVTRHSRLQCHRTSPLGSGYGQVSCSEPRCSSRFLPFGWPRPPRTERVRGASLLTVGA